MRSTTGATLATGWNGTAVRSLVAMRNTGGIARDNTCVSADGTLRAWTHGTGELAAAAGSANTAGSIIAARAIAVNSVRWTVVEGTTVGPVGTVRRTSAGRKGRAVVRTTEVSSVGSIRFTADARTVTLTGADSG